MIAGVCRRRLSSLTRRICNVTHQGAARGGPVMLRPVRATPCLLSCLDVNLIFNLKSQQYFTTERNLIQILPFYNSVTLVTKRPLAKLHF